MEISRKTNGYYDITVLPLVELWKTAEKENVVPGKSALDIALKKVSYQKMKITNEKTREITFSNPSMKLDFGAIGKGYMGDVAVEIMQKEGIPRGLVNCGGGVVVYDHRKNPHPFKIQIYSPDNNVNGSIVSLLNESVQTSGDYNRFYTIGGKKYSHIINPHTGYPEGGCHSITVKASSGTIADGYSTGFCSMVAAAAALDLENFKVDGVEILQLKKN
jgi:thiamine biosynthesis lipoprotein